MNNSIIEDLRKVKEAYAAKFNYDLEAMFRDLRIKQERSGREFVSYPPTYCVPASPPVDTGPGIVLPVNIDAVTSPPCAPTE